MQNVSASSTIQSQNGIVSRSKYKGQWMDQPIAAILLTALLPIVLCNVFAAFLMQRPVLRFIHTKDAAGRPVQLTEFSSGYLKASGVLFSVLTSKVNLCGYPLKQTISVDDNERLTNKYDVSPGLIDLLSLKKATGLAEQCDLDVCQEQFEGSHLDYVLLLVKFTVCHLLYQSDKVIASNTKLSLFGLNIDNLTMQEATDWLTDGCEQHTETAVFVNVNSVNLAANNAQLRDDINQATRVFSDGSGMRLAANSIGESLRDNINGTDLLPHLCRAAVSKNKPIYLLGAKPGVAQDTASNLIKQFPGLIISGYRDGYFQESDTHKVINEINESGAKILLVAMGSPIQEAWTVTHAKKLSCEKVLAVGGLFDFFSGRIPRAPMWMRELGMEWVWRLLQEPKTKFNRYVIGNPLFLIRVYILRQVQKRG